ncbi:MAG: hypothetical protein P8Z75_09775 [Gammaproteobacteria bacterium]|jgi:hypothetical protein
MATAFRLLISLGLILLAGCNSDSIKRNTYQSLQIMQQRECQQQPDRDCPPAESYDKYQQQRDEAIGK